VLAQIAGDGGGVMHSPDRQFAREIVQRGIGRDRLGVAQKIKPFHPEPASFPLALRLRYGHSSLEMARRTISFASQAAPHPMQIAHGGAVLESRNLTRPRPARHKPCLARITSYGNEQKARKMAQTH